MKLIFYGKNNNNCEMPETANEKACDKVTIEVRVEACPVCGKLPFKPRLIGCLHSFCEECIKNIAKPSGLEKEKLAIKCPTCQQETLLDDCNVEDLPLNYLLMRPMTVESPKCSSCMENNVAISICKDCTLHLCEECDNSHKIMRHFQTHEVIKLSKAPEGVEDDNCKEGYMLLTLGCARHAERPAESYCVRCKIMLCKVCELENHSKADHFVKCLPEAATHAYHNMEMFLKRTEHKKNHYLSKVLELLELAKTNDAMNSLNKKLIMDAEAKLCESINNWKASATAKLNDFSKTYLDLMHQRACLLYQLQHLLNSMAKNLNDNSVRNVLMQYKHWALEQQLILKDLHDLQVESELALAVDMAKVENVLELAFKVQVCRNTIENSLTERDAATPNLFGMPAGITLSTRAPQPEVVNAAPAATAEIQHSAIQRYSVEDLKAFGLKARDHLLPDDPNLAHLPDSIRADTKDGWPQDVFERLLGMRTTKTVQPPKPKPVKPQADATSWRSSAHALPNVKVETVLPLITATTNLVPAYNSPRFAHNTQTQVVPLTYMGLPLSATIKLPVQKQQLVLECAFGSPGNGNNQFFLPSGFHISPEGKIYIADTNNHRVQVFDQNGQYLRTIGSAGKNPGELWLPRKVLVMPNTNIVVCDRGSDRSRIQVFLESGTYSHNIPTRFVSIIVGIALTEDGLIAVIDSSLPGITIFDESGEMLRTFECKHFVREPSDLVVHAGNFYICDFKGHCVVVISYAGEFMCRIGYGVCGFPAGIEVLKDGRILVCDSHGNLFHMLEFQPNGALKMEYEFAGSKLISRVCGLRQLPNNNLVTLAKKNNQVLVFKWE